MITDGGEKVNNRGVLIRRVESREREKERQKKKERKGERLKGKTGTWRVEIQDLSRNPRSRTPFSEAAQKDKSGGGGRLLLVNGPTKEQKRKGEKRKGKQIGGEGKGKGSGTSSEPW